MVVCPGTAESAVVCSVLPCVCVLFLMHARSLELQAPLIVLLLLCCVLPGRVSKPCAGAALQEMALDSGLCGTFGKEVEVEFLVCPNARKAVSSTGSQSCLGG